MKPHGAMAAIGIVLVAAFLFVSCAAAQTPPRYVYTNTEYLMHQVSAGENLWLIVEQYHPNRDPRRVIEVMGRLNPGELGVLRPGQEIRIPRRVR